MIFGNFSADKKRIVENMFALIVSQGANYILPLVTFPYLLRVLGPEKFGMVAFAQAFIMYFITITNYGFVHTAPRRIAVHRDDRVQLVQIFNAVMLLKVAFLALTFIIFVLLVALVPSFRADWKIYYLTFLTVLGNVLFPAWFFQGMEHMKYISVFSLFSKLVYTVSVFIFVKTASDYLFVPFLNSLGLIISGVISLWIVVKRFQVKVRMPSMRALITELKEGWHIFLGMCSVSLYSNTNTFLLGILTNPIIVGYFSAAETLIRALDSMLNILSQAIYPYVSRLANVSRSLAGDLIRKLLRIMGGVAGILSVAIFLLARPIVDIVLGPQYTHSVVVLQILAWLLFFLVLNGILGVQGLLACNMNRAFSAIVTVVGVINIILALLLVPAYNHVGISIALLLSEISGTIIMTRYLAKEGILRTSRAAQ